MGHAKIEETAHYALNDYNCSCVAGYAGKNCSIGKTHNTFIE